jgi:hypothetical protein
MAWVFTVKLTNPVSTFAHKNTHCEFAPIAICNLEAGLGINMETNNIKESMPQFKEQVNAIKLKLTKRRLYR